MHELLQLEYWPIWFISAGMILAGVIDGIIYKVPNWLTYPLIFSGWALGLAHTLGYNAILAPGNGGIGSSLLCTLLGFAFGFVAYAVLGDMGGGDGKMVMGFGAWVGAFYPLEEAVSVFWWSMVAGILVGGVIGLGMIVYRRSFKENVQNIRTILLSFVYGQVAATGNEIRSRGPKLPYGVPLCIGFVGYLIYLHSFATS